jgi:hypothetical protein
MSSISGQPSTNGGESISGTTLTQEILQSGTIDINVSELKTDTVTVLQTADGVSEYNITNSNSSGTFDLPTIVNQIDTNETTLTDHINDASIHFTIPNIEASIDHNNIQNVGVNTHAQIDTHIADLAKHREINDAGTSTTELYSSNQIRSITNPLEDKTQNISALIGSTTVSGNLNATGAVIVPGSAGRQIKLENQPFNNPQLTMQVDLLQNATSTANISFQDVPRGEVASVLYDNFLSVTTEQSEPILLTANSSGGQPVRVRLNPSQQRVDLENADLEMNDKSIQNADEVQLNSIRDSFNSQIVISSSSNTNPLIIRNDDLNVPNQMQLNPTTDTLELTNMGINTDGALSVDGVASIANTISPFAPINPGVTTKIPAVGPAVGAGVPGDTTITFGDYKASVSGSFGNKTSTLFDGSVITEHISENTYDINTGIAYSSSPPPGAVVTETVTSTGSLYGAWVQLENTVTHLTVTGFRLYTSNNAFNNPEELVLVGSNSGTSGSWVVEKTWSNLTTTLSAFNEFILDSRITYSYLRIITTINGQQKGAPTDRTSRFEVDFWEQDTGTGMTLARGNFVVGTVVQDSNVDVYGSLDMPNVEIVFNNQVDGTVYEFNNATATALSSPTALVVNSFDSANITSNSTDFKYTIQIPGVYHINARIDISPDEENDPNERNVFLLYKNGVGTGYRSENMRQRNRFVTEQISCILPLDVGDYIDLRVLAVGTNMNVRYRNCNLCCFRLRTNIIN